MSLFNRRENERDVPEVQVQGEEAVIAAERDENADEPRTRLVKLPKTKWYAGDEVRPRPLFPEKRG